MVIDDLTLLEPTVIQTSTTNSRKGWSCQCRCGEVVRKTNKQLAVLQHARCSIYCKLTQRTPENRKLYARLWTIRDRLRRHGFNPPDPVCKAEDVVAAIGEKPTPDAVLLLKDDTKYDTIDNLYWETDKDKLARLHQCNAKYVQTPWGELSRRALATRLGVSTTYINQRLAEDFTVEEIIRRAGRHTNRLKHQLWELEGTVVGDLTIVSHDCDVMGYDGPKVYYNVACRCGNKFKIDAYYLLNTPSYDCPKCRPVNSPDCVGKLAQRAKELRHGHNEILNHDHVAEWNNRLKFVNDVCWSYRIGSVMTRPDPTKPYGPSNFKWVKSNG